MPAIICSERMRELMRMVERVAMTNATVLITGDTGSGKELVARALHHYSLRSSKPWVDVNCAALPEHLIESELFGYEKGAFSGADSTKQGLFELAHGGTLFLDEIGELDRKMQVKLLRVLDGTPYYRLGGVRKTSVDVRILTATNQDLEEATRSGAFRRDLYHRLSHIQIRVPALRERVEDIVPLAEFFLHEHNPSLVFTREGKEALRAYSWPGNVRELRNVVSKAAVLAEREEIRASDLPLGSQAPGTAENGFPTGTLDGMERQMILRVLEQTGGHQQRAAELLGISRRTLSRKLKLYGMDEAYQNCMA
ncbi:MAG: sigma-54-dependent Fis family transcriptional regulator [Acidobacteria bacterium]|nr:sigma-54-dependent Fis family transcriptional regulator [Acidobacteriota bacterium]